MSAQVILDLPEELRLLLDCSGLSNADIVRAEDADLDVSIRPVDVACQGQCLFGRNPGAARRVRLDRDSDEAQRRPLVIFSSNREQSPPEPFLRTVSSTAWSFRRSARARATPASPSNGSSASAWASVSRFLEEKRKIGAAQSGLVGAIEGVELGALAFVLLAKRLLVTTGVGPQRVVQKGGNQETGVDRQPDLIVDRRGAFASCGDTGIGLAMLAVG